MNTIRGRITKADVAKLANVSHMTVTRVLNESGYVKEETRKRVHDACDQLGYTPDLVARALKGEKTNVLGVVVPTLSHSYFARVISALESKASANGYHILVAQFHNSKLMMRDSIRSLFGRRVDGLFITGQNCSSEVYKYLSANRINSVFIDYPGPDEESIFVGVDDKNGAYEAVNYLISLGHRKIAHFAGVSGMYTTEQRIEGYKAALKDNGIEPCNEDIFNTNYDLESGYKAAETMIESGRKYTAVFCGNDYVAVGAMPVFKRNGIEVPEDISLIGFTGDEIGSYCVPSLTTIFQPAEEIGAVAMDMMIELINGKPAGKRILLKPELLVRDSTLSAKI